MDRDDHTLVAIRQNQPVHGIVRGGGSVGPTHDEALGVVAAGTTDRVHRRQVVLIQDGARLRRPSSPFVLGLPRFVEGLKNEIVSVVAKARGDLSPEPLRLRYPCLLAGFGEHHPVVMVSVDDRVHAGRKHVVRDLFHPIQPGLVDGVIRRTPHVPVPGYWDPDRAKAHRPDSIHHLLRGQGVAPPSLTAGGGIQGVAKIPPHLHIADHLGHGQSPHRALGLGGRAESGHEGKKQRADGETKCALEGEEHRDLPMGCRSTRRAFKFL